MSVLEIVSILVGLIVALRRLLGAARPIMFGLLPDKAQPYVAALLTVLPALAEQLGAARTHLDVAETVVVAAAVFFVAVRGKPAATVAALALIGVVTVSTACSVFGSDKPGITAADAYQAAKRACALYRFAPDSARTPEADAACDELEGICVEQSDLEPELEAKPPAYGNKIVAL